MTVVGQFTDARGNQITMRYVLVTPDDAELWLKANHEHNRNLIPSNIKNIVDALVDNEFLFTGEAIKFDKEGTLIDGQNRLTSIVKSGVPAHLLVIHGLEEKVIGLLDQNKSRSIRQIIKMTGNEVAHPDTVIAMQALLDRGGWGGKSAVGNKPKMAEKALANRKELEFWASWGQKMAKQTNIYIATKTGSRPKRAVSESAAAMLGLIMRRHGADIGYDNALADQFLTSVFTGVVLNPKDATTIRSVRSYLEDRNRGPLVREGGTDGGLLNRRFDTIIRSYNHWVNGKDVFVTREADKGKPITALDDIIQASPRRVRVTPEAAPESNGHRPAEMVMV